MKAVIGAYMWQCLFACCSFYCMKNYYTSDICRLLIPEVGIKIATDILYESDGCHFKLPVRG